MLISRFLFHTYILLALPLHFLKAQTTEPFTEEGVPKFLGTWVGTIIRQHPDSTQITSTPIIWKIHKIDNRYAYVSLTQNANYTMPNNTVNKITGGAAVTLNHLYVRFQDSKNCDLNLDFTVNELNHTFYLAAKNDKAIGGCYNVKISLKKINNDTTSAIAFGKPVLNIRVEGEQGKITELESSGNADMRPIPTRPIQNKQKTTIPTGGGGTPEDLGRLLLKALKTNDKKLWLSCVHPKQSSDFNSVRFDEFRKWLQEDGVSDWSMVKFSRVTFKVETVFATDNGIVNGDKVRRYFDIEFTYKNEEFLGAIGHMTISTFNGGNKFLIWFPGKDTGLMRKVK